MLPTITPTIIDMPPGGEVILRHQTWDDYETLLQTRKDRAAIKITFSAKTQEIRIMAPLPRHGNCSDTLSDLVKCLLRYQGLDWQGFDPITLKRFQQKGLEPDHCFYIQNRTAILGKDRIDLAIDPPPDLVLEVDLTSFTNAEDYEDIGVPELWIYRHQALRIYTFGDRHYQEQAESPLFPGIPVKRLIPEYVERAWKDGASVALRAFEHQLQQLS
ncbi:MAG: Uma2 family endonuclease [Cyanothece sp. SIO1E1]|nr:Uma2 family endonuclease [Cyanothece sp. SIO1E1]